MSWRWGTVAVSLLDSIELFWVVVIIDADLDEATRGVSARAHALKNMAAFDDRLDVERARDPLREMATDFAAYLLRAVFDPADHRAAGKERERDHCPHFQNLPSQFGWMVPSHSTAGRAQNASRGDSAVQ